MNRYLTVFFSSLSSTGLPDPFAKIHVDGTAQEYKTEICKASLEPKWNTHYDLYLGKNDNITISIWNQRKVQKRQGSGFLGCVRIVSSTIQRLKDTGCKYLSQCLNIPTPTGCGSRQRGGSVLALALTVVDKRRQHVV